MISTCIAVFAAKRPVRKTKENIGKQKKTFFLFFYAGFLGERENENRMFFNFPNFRSKRTMFQSQYLVSSESVLSQYFVSDDSEARFDGNMEEIKF